jgi:hypothetical protein
MEVINLLEMSIIFTDGEKQHIDLRIIVGEEV